MSCLVNAFNIPMLIENYYFIEKKYLLKNKELQLL